MTATAILTKTPAAPVTQWRRRADRFVTLSTGGHRVAVASDRLSEIRREVPDAIDLRPLVAGAGAVAGEMESKSKSENGAARSCSEGGTVVLLRCGADGAADLPVRVDAVDRPRMVPVPDRRGPIEWIAAGCPLPVAGWLSPEDPANNGPVPVLATERLHRSITADVNPHTHPPREFQSAADRPLPPATSGRGLLVFCPAESDRIAAPAAVAVPMSMVLHVGRRPATSTLPVGGSLRHVAWWSDRVVGCLDLGNELAFAPEVTPADGPRWIVVRTPGGRVVAFDAHPQMRTLRTPPSRGGTAAGGGRTYATYQTDAGPLAVPDLDSILTSFTTL